MLINSIRNDFWKVVVVSVLNLLVKRRRNREQLHCQADLHTSPVYWTFMHPQSGYPQTFRSPISSKQEGFSGLQVHSCHSKRQSPKALRSHGCCAGARYRHRAHTDPWEGLKGCREFLFPQQPVCIPWNYCYTGELTEVWGFGIFNC